MMVKVCLGTNFGVPDSATISTSSSYNVLHSARESVDHGTQILTRIKLKTSLLATFRNSFSIQQKNHIYFCQMKLTDKVCNKLSYTKGIFPHFSVIKHGISKDW